MIFRLNNKLVEINKDAFNTDKEFYEAIMQIMIKITNIPNKDPHVYTSTKIEGLLKHTSTNHNN